MEIYRLWFNKKLCSLLVGLFFLNIVMFAWLHPAYSEDELLQSTGNQMDYLESYSSYVDDVIVKASRVLNNSFFINLEEKYSLENAKNIMTSYGRIQGIEVQSGNDLPVVEFVNFAEVRYVSVLMILLIVFHLVREQKKGISQVIYTSANGRCVFGVKRGFFIIVASFVITLVNMLSVLIESLCIHGVDVNFGRSIQSIEIFRDITYRLSIGDFLLRYFILNAIAIAVIGMFTWAVMSLIGHPVGALVSIVATFLMEFIWIGNIVAQSNWRLLKYVNIMEYINVEDYLFQYYDLNIADNAVNLLLVIKDGMLLLLAVFFCVGIYAFARKREAVQKKLKIGFLEKIKGLQEIYNLVLMEIYKILIGNRGIVIIVITVFVAILLSNQRNIVYTEIEQYINNFYEHYSGEITDKVYQFVDSEREYVTDAYETYAEISELYTEGDAERTEYIVAVSELQKAKIAEAGLAKIEAELQRATYLQETRDVRIQLVNSIGYNKLFGNIGRSTQRELAVIMLLSILLIISRGFNYEERSQMTTLLRSTENGRRKLLGAKRQSAYIITILMYVLLYGINIYCVEKQYGLSNLLATVQSVEILELFPFEMSIVGYIILILISRLLVYLIFVEFLFSLSMIIENKVLILLFIVCIISPILLDIDVVSYFECVNVNGIISGQMNGELEYVKLMLLGLITLVIRFRAYKKWCGNDENGDKKLKKRIWNKGCA